MKMNTFIRGRTGTSVRLVVAFAAVVFGGTAFVDCRYFIRFDTKAKSVVTLQYWNTYNHADAEGRTMENIIIPALRKAESRASR